MAASPLTDADIERMGIAVINQAFSGQVSSPLCDDRVNSLAYSECGTYLYTATNDGVLALFEAHSGQRVSEYHLKDFGCRLVTATHHPMGVLHASCPPRRSGSGGGAGSGGGTPRITPLDLGQVTYHNLHENRVVRYFRGHTDRVTSISMNPVNDLVLTTSLDNTFRLWDLRTAKELAVGPLYYSEDSAGASSASAASSAAEKRYADVLEPRGCFDHSGMVFAVAVAVPEEKPKATSGAPISLSFYSASDIGIINREFSRCFFPHPKKPEPFYPAKVLSFTSLYKPVR